MRILILAFILSGVAHAAPGPSFNPIAFDLELRSAGREVHPALAGIEESWSDPETPSCMVFKFREQQVLKQAQELDYLLNRMNARKRHPTRAELLELKQMQDRQEDLARELKEETLIVSATFALPLDVPDRPWVEKMNYALDIESASLTWHGASAAAPQGVTLQVGADQLKVQVGVNLADACSKPLNFGVALIQN